MRISQVLINLLGNAVKFTPEQGRVTLTVREDRTEEGTPLVRFSVEDTGIGIPKEEQDRVFRAFEQAAANPSKQQGTGLGLSISSGQSHGDWNEDRGDLFCRPPHPGGGG